MPSGDGRPAVNGGSALGCDWRPKSRGFSTDFPLDFVSPPAGEPLHSTQRHATVCVEEETQELH